MTLVNILDEIRNDTCDEMYPILDTVKDNSLSLTKQNFTMELIHDKVEDIHKQNCTVVLTQVSGVAGFRLLFLLLCAIVSRLKRGNLYCHIHMMVRTRQEDGQFMVISFF